MIPRGPSRLEAMRPAVLADGTGGESTETAPGELAPEYPFPGKSYIVHYGDELRDIAQAASVFGQPVSVQDILAANPGLDASRCRVGQKIMIPKLTLDKPESIPAGPANPPAPESPDSRPMSAADSPH